MTDLTGFTAALAAPDQPKATFDALARLTDETIGVKLFTVMTMDTTKGLAQRIYSNDNAAYPTGGSKPIIPNDCNRCILDKQIPFVANSIEDIANVFGDWEQIQALGCESCLNLPVVIGSKVVGSLNCLDKAGHYTPERVATAQALILPGAAAFLISAQNQGTLI